MKVSLQRVRINQGGYDDTGSYWGVGQPLYRYSDEDGEIDNYVRAYNREDAKAVITARYPNAQFYR